MPLGNENVFPAVVIGIKEESSPSCRQPAGLADAGSVGHVIKTLSTEIAKQSVLFKRECRNEDIGPAVVVVIGKIYAHACEGVPIFVVGCTGKQGLLGEGPITVVSEQGLRYTVVGYHDVGPPVSVEVVEGHSQSLAWVLADAARPRHVQKCPVALVLVKEVGNGGKLRSEEHTSELQSHHDLVCRLLLEKKNNKKKRQEIGTEGYYGRVSSSAQPTSVVNQRGNTRKESSQP